MFMRRLLLPFVLAVTASGAVTMINQMPASAGNAIRVVQIPCPGWVPSPVGVYAVVEGLVSVDQAFFVADSRIVVNDLDTPATATFTSQISNTFQLTLTSGMTTTVLKDYLTANVSSAIVSSATTQIGVSTTAQVPAHGAVIGDYGVEGFNVTYRAYVVNRRSIGGCWVHQETMGHEEAFTPAPTYIQGWRLRQA
jgi:hypothetical protein